MLCDIQNKDFLRQNSKTKSINKKTIVNTITNHRNNKNNNMKKNKKEKNLTNSTLEIMKFCQLNAQLQQQQQLTQAQIRPEQTIIRKIFKQETSTTAQQAIKQTQMNLKEYLKFSNDTSATAMTSTIAAKITTAIATSKRINKRKYMKQKGQNLEQKNSINYSCMPSINPKKNQHQHQLKLQLATTKTKVNTTDPDGIAANLPTTSQSSCTSLSLPMTMVPPLMSTKICGAQAANITDVDEHSQSKTQQCNNVCIISKLSSKQKCIQHKKQQQYCRSANMICSRNNNNSYRTYVQTNINTHNARVAVPVATANTITTTNKANISYNTISTAITTSSSTVITIPTSTTNNFISTANTATESASRIISTIPSAPATISAVYKLFPLRQLYHNTQQLKNFLRAAIFSCMFIMSMQYETGPEPTISIPHHEPMFISRSETFKFVTGDTIILPCEVANTDPYIVAWKRGIAILTAGTVKVTPDPRVRIVNGFNLQIRDAVPQDAGDYICQIATMNPREITHTVEILVPPRIHHISTSGHLQVKKGSSVRIECSASGNPTPNVTWSRKNNILPNGEEKLHSHILSIENVDRHKGGVYICTANNGVGQPASSQVVLHVLYPPEITVERPVVFSGEGHEALLVCIVHGETQPEVIWFKDTMQLDTTERHIMENRGSRHTLIIRKVHPQDFGNYSCVAENQLGKSRKTLQLSGKPNVAVFNSPPISQYKDRYNISWTVESHTPIEEYKLSFRRLQQGQEVDNSIDSHSSHSSSSSMLQMYGGGSLGSMNSGNMMGINTHNYRLGGFGSMNGLSGSGGYGNYGTGNIIHWGRNDWRDVVLPAIPISHHYTQGMSYMIRGLDPDQHYEATVQSRNRYGWSDYSQSFVFSTSSNDNEMRDLSVTFYGSKAVRIYTLGTLFFAATVTSAAASLCLTNLYF